MLVANDDFLSRSSRLIYKRPDESSLNQVRHQKALFLPSEGATESPVRPNGFHV